MNLNPMNITGPTSPAPYVQADVRNPTVNANVASYSVGNNVLNISQPVTRYSEPLGVKDKPNGFATPSGS